MGVVHVTVNAQEQSMTDFTDPTTPVALLGVPYDASSSFLRGPAEAPAAIRAALASEHTNGWSESLLDVRGGGWLRDDGDVAVSDADPRAAIERAVASVLASGARPLSLGGDHSITHPILRAVRRHHARLTVLHIDAHPDLYDALDGDRHSHACPFARVLEEGLADRLVQVGIRTMNAHQRAQAERFGVETIDMRAWAAGARPQVDGPIYVSLDVDALDPAFAPGVSHREPGGLTVREVLGVLQAIDAPIVGGDVVELNPRRDPTGATADVCAKLVRELAAAMRMGAARGGLDA
jgi:arginase